MKNASAYLPYLSDSLVVNKHVEGLHPSNWYCSTWLPETEQFPTIILERGIFFQGKFDKCPRPIPLKCDI